MKKEIKGKEYNVKKLTWKDFGEFVDYLLNDKLKAYSRYADSVNINNVELDFDLRSVLKQIGLTTDIKMDILKNLESALKRIQSKQNGIDDILSTGIPHEEASRKMFSPAGMVFIIWLAIRDNGVKFEDMDSIIDFGNAIEVMNFIEIIGLKQQISEDDKKKKKEPEEPEEVENPSPLENASSPIADSTE